MRVTKHCTLTGTQHMSALNCPTPVLSVRSRLHLSGLVSQTCTWVMAQIKTPYRQGDYRNVSASGRSMSVPDHYSYFTTLATAVNTTATAATTTIATANAADTTLARHAGCAPPLYHPCHHRQYHRYSSHHHHCHRHRHRHHRLCPVECGRGPAPQFTWRKWPRTTHRTTSPLHFSRWWCRCPPRV